MEKFNQSQYINDYRKAKKKQFNVDLNKEEFEELNKILKDKNMTKVDFVRQALKRLKENI